MPTLLIGADAVPVRVPQAFLVDSVALSDMFADCSDGDVDTIALPPSSSITIVACRALGEWYTRGSVPGDAFWRTKPQQTLTEAFLAANHLNMIEAYEACLQEFVARVGSELASTATGSMTGTVLEDATDLAVELQGTAKPYQSPFPPHRVAMKI